MRDYIIRYFITFFALLLVSCSGSKQSPDPETFESKLHSPVEILRIMEKSTLIYNIDLLEDSELIPFDPPQSLSNQYYLSNDNGSLELMIYKLGKKDIAIFNMAEDAFLDNKYDEAISYYLELFERNPHYAFALTMVGDAYYMSGNFADARKYFKRAIKINPIDYTAHWFLGDTYLEENKLDSANYYITKAHILNKYNLRLNEKLRMIREEIGRPWEDWYFHPQYLLTKTKKGVEIKVKPTWMGYALVKAIWQYEPGYAEQMIGEKYDDNIFNTTEETEALISLLAVNKTLTHINTIINEGYFNEFFLYEIVGNKQPIALLLTSDEQINRIIDYLNKFH